MTKGNSTRKLRCRCILMLSFMLCTGMQIIAQEVKVVRDLNLWTGASIEKEIVNDFTVSLEQELRLKRNLGEVKNYFTQLGIGYRINRNFDLEFRYRYIRDHKRSGDYENASRYMLDLKYSGKIHPVSFHYRARYQKEVESLNLLDLTLPYEKYFRNKIETRYNGFDRFTPTLSAELFQLHTLQTVPKFEMWRLLAGCRLDIMQNGLLELEYGIDREIADYAPYTIFIMKINYRYSL